MFRDNFKIYYRATVQLSCLFATGLLLFMSFRTALLLSFGSYSELSAHVAEVIHAYWVGFRFDTTVLTYGLLLPFALNHIILIIPYKAANYYRILKMATLIYTLSVFSSFSLLLFIDYYYFQFFQTHFNILLFGLIYDDTKAVLSSVCSDYPVLKVLAIYIITTIAMTLIFRKVSQRDFRAPFTMWHGRLLFIVTITGLYILGMRGSTGPIPICKREDASISSYGFINELALNGVFSLREAIEEQRKQQVHTDIPDMLHNYGFGSPAEAISAYLGKQVDASGNLQRALLAKTPPNALLSNAPPHVVFVLVESMGNYYQELSSHGLNLLGELEQQLHGCLVFRNFLPATDLTIGSLEGIVINSPQTPVSQTVWMDKPLASSVALPFYKAGYHTSFITGAKAGWRNLENFIPKQYFQTFEAAPALLAEVESAIACEWGVHDNAVYDRILSKLEHAQGKPQFIFGMTVSNHTPFDIPESYQNHPLSIPGELKSRLRVDEEIALKNIRAARYTNDCLGKFLKKLRKSPFAGNTIVAVTGDHNTLQAFNFNTTHLLQKYSVPFILYLPEAYRPKVEVDTGRFGSHKDIFPTLFHLSLSAATYLKSGINMLDTAESTPDTYFAVHNYNIAMNARGCVFDFAGKPYYYKWQYGKTLAPVAPEDLPHLSDLSLRARGYTASMNFFVQSELLK